MTDDSQLPPGSQAQTKTERLVAARAALAAWEATRDRSRKPLLQSPRKSFAESAALFACVS
jgi:hypothetical protein